MKSILFRNPLFATLDHQSKNKLLHRATVQDYVDGEIIIKEGDDASFIYIVKSGSVQVIVNSKVVAEIFEGQAFGESSLLGDQSKRSASIRAVGITKVISINSKAVIKIVGDDYKMIFFRNIILNALASDDDLKYLDVDILKKIVDLCEINTFCKHDVINITKESLIDKAFIICYGRITSKENSFKTYQLIGFNNINQSQIGESEYICDIDTTIAEVSITVIEGAVKFSLKSLRDTVKKINYIQSIPLFASVDYEGINYLCRKLQSNEYPKGMFIFVENTDEEVIYIIEEGSIALFQDKRLVATLDKGCIFGEACLADPCRYISAKALVDVKLLELKASKIKKFMNKLMEKKIKTKLYIEKSFVLPELYIRSIRKKSQYRKNILVIHKYTKNLYYAEIIEKNSIFNHEEFQHLIDQKTILIQIDYQFIPKLIRTFTDARKVYFIYEYFPFQYLSSFKKIKFSELQASFVLNSLSNILYYLSKKNIIHRNICLESVLIDEEGYIWLENFCYAKIIENRTFTRLNNVTCQAPEILLGRGYNKASDY